MLWFDSYELYPRYDFRKSFYGKAQVIEMDGKTYLRSYNTIVCGIVDGSFKRFWAGWSATTGRHVNEFARQFLHKPVSKSEWDEMEVESLC